MGLRCINDDVGLIIVSESISAIKGIQACGVYGTVGQRFAPSLDLDQ